MNFQEKFESFNKITNKLPNLYQEAATSMGFLTLSGSESLIPLDGQHRLKAIEFAISGKDEAGKDIVGTKPCPSLASDDVTVLLVKYEPQKARRIFSKVNRYAKPTGKGQNLLTDDDDVIAVLTRFIVNEIFGGRLVRYLSTTLRPNDPEFTTLSILYDCNQMIIENDHGVKINKLEMPDVKKVALYQETLLDVWETLTKNITLFSDALSDHNKSGDEKRIEIRRDFLLGKPIPQYCLVKAFMRLTLTNMSRKKACENLNKLPWGITNDDIKVWDRVLWSGEKIITKKKALAADLIAYMAGEKLNEQQKSELRERYRNEFPAEERSSRELPRVFV